MKPNKLKIKEIKRLRKNLPKIPKKQLSKEELEWRSAFKKAKIEEICWYLMGVFFIVMVLISIYLLYLSLTYKI